MARLNECQILAPYPFGIPTLRGYPPPPARRQSEFPAPSQRRVTPISYTPPPIRSRTYRRFHDCLFIPNIEDVAELVDARRRILGLESEYFGRNASKVAPKFTSPLAIGLMLAVMPPLAVALVWSSRHFAHTAKVAITIYGMFTFVSLLVAITMAMHG